MLRAGQSKCGIWEEKTETLILLRPAAAGPRRDNEAESGNAQRPTPNVQWKKSTEFGAGAEAAEVSGQRSEVKGWRKCLPKCAVKSRNPPMGLIILILVILLLIGAFPTGGYGYGYRSHGIIGTILIIVLILYLLGRL
jgi:Protein of unknown function (DUF3309)